MNKSPFTAEQLEAFRQQSDPLADDVVKQIMASGSGRSISEIFDKLIRNKDYDAIDLPPEISNYFKTTGGLPEWADQAKIKAGQEVFAEFGPSICLLLLCKSLPEAYSCKKGAQVMFQTGRMAEGPEGSLKRFTRRLMETSQFVINVCSPGGFDSDGAGLITAQKVRLIHATIRYFIMDSGRWDAEDLGLPINQEDLAGTLQSFSSLILEGLGQLGITLNQKQIEGYFHCWRIAGHIVGLDPQLNPETYEEGLAVGYSILNHQKAKSEAGAVLTKAVVDFMEDLMPGNVFNGTPSILIRYFVGDKTADMLSVHKEEGLLPVVLPRLLKLVFHLEEKLEQNSKLYREIAGHVSIKVLQGLINHFDEYKGVHFYLPPDLKENWRLIESWEHYKTISPAIAGYRLAIEKKKSSLK